MKDLYETKAEGDCRHFAGTCHVCLGYADAAGRRGHDPPATRYATPDGYNDHDYQKMVAFFEQTDENGVRNGEKLSEDYDPTDSETYRLA